MGWCLLGSRNPQYSPGGEHSLYDSQQSPWSQSCGTIPDVWKGGYAMGLLCVPGNGFLFPEAAGRAALS